MTFFEIEQHLIETAKKYSEDELRRYQSELGWEDWMNNYTEASDGEEITEAESNEIDRITEEAFWKAHNPSLGYIDDTI